MASLTTTELLPNISIQAVGIFIGSLILLVRFKINPIHVMLLSGVAEVVLQLIGKIFT
jgi:chromate transporter